MCMLNCDMYFMHINVSGRLVLLINKLIDWSSAHVNQYCNLLHFIFIYTSHISRSTYNFCTIGNMNDILTVLPQNKCRGAVRFLTEIIAKHQLHNGLERLFEGKMTLYSPTDYSHGWSLASDAKSTSHGHCMTLFTGCKSPSNCADDVRLFSLSMSEVL